MAVSPLRGRTSSFNRRVIIVRRFRLSPGQAAKGKTHNTKKQGGKPGRSWGGCRVSGLGVLVHGGGCREWEDAVSARLTLPFLLGSASHPAPGSANQRQRNLKPRPGGFSGPIFHSPAGGWGCGDCFLKLTGSSVDSRYRFWLHLVSGLLKVQQSIILSEMHEAC